LAASVAWTQATVAAGARGAADHRITLDIEVDDKAGNPVSGLRAEDFTILDNKRPQSASDFRAAEDNGKSDAPLVRVVFVIDEVNASFRAMSNARQQLERYLRESGESLPVPMSLVVFSEKSTQVQSTPTRNGNVLADSVRAMAAGAPRELEGGEFANRIWRLQTSLRALVKLASYKAKQPGRKLLIWFSSGWPLIIEAADKLTPRDQQEDFNTLVQLSTTLREGHITVYGIDPLGADDAASLGNVYYENFLQGVPSANKFQSGDLTLGVIAIQSGGQVLNRSNDVSASIAKCVADAKAYYTLSFEAGPAGHRDEYHELQVKMNRPGLQARTRTGYYAQP
jgi:VWFA-related protein